MSTLAHRSRRLVSKAARRNLFLEKLENRWVFATGTVALSSTAYSGPEDGSNRRQRSINIGPSSQPIPLLLAGDP